MEFNYEASVSVRFAEDLTFAETAPLLDSFGATPVFRVRGDRVAWSGPAGGGPEIALVLEAILGAGGVVAAASFAKSFGDELGKDAYRGVRSAIIALIRKLHRRAPDDRRAIVGLVVKVGDVRIFFGPDLSDANPDVWTDERLVAAFGRAQAILDEARSAAPPPKITTGPDLGREYWVSLSDPD
jgi:hypothetical protein